MIGEKERFRQRIEFGIQALTNEDYQILLNIEFVEYLPHAICDLLQKDDSEQVLNILSKLGESATGAKSKLREHSVTVLSLLLDRLLCDKKRQLIPDVVHILADWLRVETEYSSSYDVVCTQLLNWGKAMFRQGRFEDLDYLLMTIHHIESGRVQKSNVIVSHIRRIQEQFAADDIVDDLLQSSLTDDDQSCKVAGNLLAHMGPSITDYLLDKLLICESKKLRFQLIKMITSKGTSISQRLVNRIEQHSPWYFIRNIILMMSMIDDSSMFPVIKTFLSHKDIRVQQQVIHYIGKEGGERKKDYLTEALFVVCDELKLKSIMELASIGGEEVVEVFMDLLDLRENFSVSHRDELLKNLCIGFEETTQERAVELLTQIINERKKLNGTNGTDDKVIVAAESSLNKIEPGIRHIYKETNNIIDEHEYDLEDQISFASTYNEKDLEEKVPNMPGEGQNGIAEDVWSELKERITDDEFNLFYDSLQQRKYDKDEIIVRHGNYDPCLYFVKAGFVNLTSLCGDYEKFLKRLRKGDVIGYSSFFDASVWSVTLVAQKNVHLYCLKYDSFTQLALKYPDLEKKLREYCADKDRIPELLKISGEERRQSPRFKAHDIIINTLLDRFGTVGKREFKAEIIEVSAGGLNCLIRINKRQNARLLLGRMISSQIDIGKNDHLKCKGTIIGVKEQKDMDMHYSVHVRFDDPLPQTSVVAIVNYNKDN